MIFFADSWSPYAGDLPRLHSASPMLVDSQEVSSPGSPRKKF